MELTDIRELYRNRENYMGKEVTVGGWVRSNRDSKNFGFLVINEGNCCLYIDVFHSPEYFFVYIWSNPYHKEEGCQGYAVDDLLSCNSFKHSRSTHLADYVRSQGNHELYCKLYLSYRGR